MQRMGWVIGIDPQHIAEYKQLHAAVWPAVLQRIRQSQLRNYSIYLREPENLLFGYWEYHGADWPTDAARLGREPAVQAWLALTDPCQQPLASAKDGEWWAVMEEVFHLD